MRWPWVRRSKFVRVGWAMPRVNGPFPHLNEANLALYSEERPWWPNPIPIYMEAE